MSTTTWGWLVLLFPLLGTVVISFGFRFWGRTAGWLGTLAIALAFACSIGMLISLLSHPAGHRELTSNLWNYDVSTGVDARFGILVDPVSVYMALVVSGVSTLIHLYSISYLESDRGYAR